MERKETPIDSLYFHNDHFTFSKVYINLDFFYIIVYNVGIESMEVSLWISMIPFW